MTARYRSRSELDQRASWRTGRMRKLATGLFARCDGCNYGALRSQSPDFVVGPLTRSDRSMLLLRRRIGDEIREAAIDRRILRPDQDEYERVQSISEGRRQYTSEPGLTPPKRATGVVFRRSFSTVFGSEVNDAKPFRRTILPGKPYRAARRPNASVALANSD